MRFRKMRDVIAPALLLFALLVPSAAKGQSDSFFYIDEDDYRGGTAAGGAGSWLGLGDNTGGTGSWLGIGDNTGGTGSWLGFGENTEGEASWVGFEDGDPLPTGTGLLVMALSGVCYAGAKVKRGVRSVKRVVRRD